MRLCPTVEGSPSPLIMHRIGADVCQSRQGANFHKCHRCVYRGKPADWKPEGPPHLTIELEPRRPNRNGTAPAVREPSTVEPVVVEPVGRGKTKARRRRAGKRVEAEA